MAKEIDFEMVTTKGGDGGESSLYNGERRRKDDLVFEVLGDLDELGSFLGLAKAETRDTEIKRLVEGPQRMLQRLGSLVATPAHDPLFERLAKIGESEIRDLESEEKRILEETKIEPVFVLPGGNRLSASLDVARTVARRAERKLVALIRERGCVELADCQKYLTRLSDYLFVLARREDNRQDGLGEEGL